MNNLQLQRRTILALAALLTSGVLFAQSKPPAKPADVMISVSPEVVTAGEEATITVRIDPIAGVKINKYPKIKLQVPEQKGLVGEGYAEMGNARPPAPDKMDTNYYKKVDPLDLTLKVDTRAKAGSHEVDAKLTYFYCVAASGFCAPARVAVKIPVAVR